MQDLVSNTYALTNPPPPLPAYNNWCPDYSTTSPIPADPLLPPMPTYLSNNPSPPFYSSWILFLGLTFCKHFPCHHDLIYHYVKLHLLPQESIHIWVIVHILHHPKVWRLIHQPSSILIFYHLVLGRFSLEHWICHHHHAITFGWSHIFSGWRSSSPASLWFSYFLLHIVGWHRRSDDVLYMRGR